MVCENSEEIDRERKEALTISENNCSTEKKIRANFKKITEINEVTKNFFTFDWYADHLDKYEVGNNSYISITLNRSSFHSSSILALYWKPIFPPEKKTGTCEKFKRGDK